MGELEDRIAQLEAENAQLRTQAAGAGASAGPGTPEHFYAVGGIGDPVAHPETGEPIRNPQTGAPVIQEHPRIEADAMVAAAERQLVSAEAAVEDARAGLAAAQEQRAHADERYAEILAHLAAQAQEAS